MRLARAAAAAFAFAGIAGCGSLPTIVPDMAPRPSRPVQLEGASGPLSAQQSKAVLARLESRGQETSIFDRHLALEESISGSPLVTGNKVTLLQDGPSTYKAMLESIRGAERHIDVETYIIEDDEVGNRFADALIEKQSRGVQVSLLYDSVGSMNTPKAFFQRLAGSGVKVLEYNPINPLTAAKGWDVNQRDHRKLLLVDGRTAFLGGINISSVYSAGSFRHDSKQRPDGSLPWRDTHLKVEGPVVADFQALFLASWKKQKGELQARSGPPPVPAARGKEVVGGVFLVFGFGEHWIGDCVQGHRRRNI